MKNRTVVLTIFIAAALVQLWVPAKMIYDKELLLKSGKEFRFKTLPVDPTDPLRGKYINLSFQNNTVKVTNEKEWNAGEEVYAILATDSLDFALVKSLSKEKVSEDVDFVRVVVALVSNNGTNTVTISYPFNRYYCEETKAFEAEKILQQVQRDTTKQAYALVSISHGEWVLKDLQVNGVPFKDVVRK